MLTAILLAASVPLSTPVPASSADVTYDEAIACAFLGISLGMDNERPREVTREIMAMGVRYIEAAQLIGGKTQTEVVADMGERSGDILAEVQAASNARAEIDRRWSICAERAAMLPAAD